MNIIKLKSNKILKLILCNVIFFSILPLITYATSGLNENKEIVDITNFKEDVVLQEFIVGQSDVTPILPDKINAEIVTTIGESVENTIRQELDIVWNNPSFTTDHEKTFIYKPSLVVDDYTLADDVTLPTITVEVLNESAAIVMDTKDVEIILCGHTSKELNIKGDKQWNIKNVPLDTNFFTEIVNGKIDLDNVNHKKLIESLPQNIGEFEKLKDKLGNPYNSNNGPIGYYNGASQPLSKSYPITWEYAENKNGDISITGSFESQSKHLVQFTTSTGIKLPELCIRYGLGMKIELPIQVKENAKFMGWMYEGTIYNADNPYIIVQGIEPNFIEVWESSLFDNEKFHVETVSPDHVTINLFDYWKIDEHSVSMHDPKLNYQQSTESGINKNKALKFWPHYMKHNGEDDLGKEWHSYTGSAHEDAKDFNGLEFKHGPFTGILENTLDKDGYPLLSDDTGNTKLVGGAKAFSDSKGYDWNPSLDYLFEPESGDIDDHEILQHRNEYLDVKGLLQLDKDGSYYYNSLENFAELNKETNEFTLYNAPAVKNDKSGTAHGQFFPFDNAEEVFNIPDEGATKLTHNEDVIANNNVHNTLNHYMGLSLKTQFIQPLDGNIRTGDDYTSTKDDTPMYLEFIGDDDIWIYIDGVMVADMGGLRDAMYCYIDFSTGDVKVMRHDDYEAFQKNPNHKPKYPPIETTLLEIFKNAGRDVSDFDMNKFADNSDHVLDVFYLERGAGGSDLRVEFNLINKYTQSIKKVDQDGNPIKDVTFDLFRVTGENKWSDIKSDATPIMTITSDENGQLPLTYPSSFTDIPGMAGKPVDFDKLAQMGITKFVAREKNHIGYIPVPDIWIEYDPILHVLNIVNPWETGVSTSNNVHLSQVQKGIQLKNKKEVVGMTDKNGVINKNRSITGTVIGLPYFLPEGKDLLNQSNWQPIYGSINDGFHALHKDYLELPPHISQTYGSDWTILEQSTLAMMMQLGGKIIDKDGNVHTKGIGMGQYEEWILSIKPGPDKFEGDIMGLPDNLSDYVFIENGNYQDKNHTLGYWFFDFESLQVDLDLAIKSNNVLSAEGPMNINEAKKRDLVYFDKNSLIGINEILKNGTQEEKNKMMVSSYNTRVTGDDTGSKVGSFEKTLQWIKIIAKYMHAVDLSSFDKTYTSDIIVPNVLRTFEIQKIGDNGKKLGGTQFGIYDNAACIGNALSTGTTDKDGKIIVSNEANGSIGSMKFHLNPKSNTDFTTYYLKEISAPNGYDINDTIIKVNVDISGVYIDAGNSTDDVSVRSSLVGSVPTVAMFGISDNYNETLKNIHTLSYKLDDFTLDRSKWIKGKDSIIYTQTNKHYSNDYLPHKDGLQYYEVDEGLVVMYITQYNPTADYKDDLSNENITRLFEVVQTVVVTDQQTPDLYDWKIEIEIEGEGTVNPDGGIDRTVYVMDGGNQSFGMTPADGWYLFDVQIDGVSIGDPSTYDFKNVTQDHKIKVIFKENKILTNPPLPPTNPPTEPPLPPTNPPTEPPLPPTNPPTEPTEPQTGDATNIITLLCISLSSIVLICKIRKKINL